MKKISILNPESFSISDWSGGKTKEVYIFPQTSLYQERDFDFRLSSATVSLKETSFSDLNGYHRLIMTLDKPMSLLNLETKEKVDLDPFDTFYFEGSDRIKSFGECTDFNLIYNDNYCGQMMAVTSNNDPICNSQSIQMVYALCDMIFQINFGEKRLLKANHLLVIEKKPQTKDCLIDLIPIGSCQSTLAVWAGLSYRKGFGLHD